MVEYLDLGEAYNIFGREHRGYREVEDFDKAKNPLISSIEYSTTSELLPKLLKLQDQNPTGLDLVVVSNEIIPHDDGTFSEGKDLGNRLKTTSEGIYLLDDDPCSVIFERFFMYGELHMGDTKIQIVPEKPLVSVAKVAEFSDDDYLNEEGNVRRRILDYRLKPQRSDWKAVVESAVKGRVELIMLSSGLIPSLIFHMIDKVCLDETSLQDYIQQVRESECSSGIADAEFQNHI